MKKVMKKKNYSNRFIYFLVTLGIFTLLAGGVYAISSVSSGANSGHPAGDIDFSSGINTAIFSTNQPTYAQTKLNTWGLDSSGTMYLEPAPGQTLYLTDQWSKTGQLNIQFGSVVSSSSISAPSFLYSSDKSLKTNIVPIPNALERLQQLNGVSFNWKATGRADDGLIAQEVEKVFPELVSTDSAGLKSVAYGNLVGVLVEAIKEQQKQIDELKSKLAK